MRQQWRSVYRSISLQANNLADSWESMKFLSMPQWPLARRLRILSMVKVGILKCLWLSSTFALFEGLH